MKFNILTKLATVAAVLLWIIPAHALEVEEAEVEKGVEIETENTYTDDNGGDEGNYERGTEIEVGIGITDWLRFAVEVEFEEEEDESPFRLSEWGFNVIIELIDPEAGVFGAAIYAGIEHERNFDGESGDNEVFAGVILEKKIQQITLRTNLLYVTDLNEADETFEGYDVNYQAVYNFNQNVNLGLISLAGIGVEGYFSHRDPDEAGEETEETHLVGPVFYHEGGFVQDMLNAVFNRDGTANGDDDDESANGDDDDEGIEVSGNIGVLFGTDDDSADVVVKWNSEIEF